MAHTNYQNWQISNLKSFEGELFDNGKIALYVYSLHISARVILIAACEYNLAVVEMLSTGTLFVVVMIVFSWITRNICPCTLCIGSVSSTHLGLSNKDGED